MARSASKSSAITVSRPNPYKGKLLRAEERLKAVAKRAHSGMMEQEEAAIAIGAPLVLGLLEARGTRLPTVGGIDPAIVWGAALALLGPKALKGKNGKRIAAAGVGLLSSAARDSGKRGSLKVGEDEGEEYPDS